LGACKHPDKTKNIKTSTENQMWHRSILQVQAPNGDK